MQSEMSREDSLKAQEQFLLTDQSTAMDILLDGTNCKILVGSGAGNNVLPKISSKAKVIQVEYGASVKILFVIPFIIASQGHMFEMYTSVSKMYDNVDLFLCAKYFVELETEISMRELKFKFLNRSLPVFPMHKEMVKPKERSFLKVEAPFLS